MKKIFPLIILILGIAGTASANCLMYHDFENITDNAVTYISGCDDIVTSSTNNGIKSYDFINENDNTRLAFTGYKTVEKDGNATRTFTFLFPEYSTSKYPDTKLVLGYDETVDEKKNESYLHVQTLDDANACMSQLFVFPNDDSDNLKMQNTGTVKTVSHGDNTEYKIISNMDTQTFIFNVGNDFSDTYSFKNSVSKLSKMTWTVDKDDVYSIDNVYAWVVPNKFKIKSYDADIDNKTVSLYLSAPADKSSLDNITINGSDDITVTQDFESARIDILFDKLGEYGIYTIDFGNEFKDIAGNIMTDSVVFGETLLMYHDFENITDNAVTYISGRDDILTSSTNFGIKSYDFMYENGSVRLCFTGYKTAEVDGNGNASRKFEFLFPKYSLEKYPDTKLVLGYDETVYERVNTNYLHTTTSNDENTQMSQLFAYPDGTDDILRMFYDKDLVRVPFGTNTERKLIADIKTQKFIFAVGDDFAKEYDFGNGKLQNSLTELSKIIWYPNKDERYSIDNIYAYVVPNTFSVKEYKVNMGEKKISLYLSAPADKSVINKITLSGIDDIKVTQDFKEARIDITSDKIGYGKKYTVNFGDGFKDIAGNTFTSDFEVETDAFPQFDITTEKNGTKYRVYAENQSVDSANAYIIAGRYGENGLLEECAFFAADFAPGIKQGFECEFKTDGTVKVFAAEKAGE